MSSPSPMPPDRAAELRERARAIRLLCCDVDGVLTDGRLHFFEEAGGVREGKSFSILDGFGIKLLQDSGVVVALITGRRSGIVLRRANEIGIRHVVQGAEDKKQAWTALLAELDLAPESSAYIGDDWPDLPVIRACGLGITVPGAPEPMRRHARYVTRASGGFGAVREACELIMDAQGTLEARLATYLL
jgi:3-deoxy-D-manno-octulosonate 8-phosphate phosphatase (KDO 8-P phosphatase)